MKRIVTIQDISGVGKCSVTIAQPLVSAMGVECAVLPTAVLSTHTMFQGFTFCDLTPEFEKIADHWADQGITFDAIYTGYLGSFEQLELVSRFIDRFKGENTLVVIDPVMGDHGKLYPGFTPAFAKEMGNLCAKADLILPNLTEASFMLDIPYDDALTPEKVKAILSAQFDVDENAITEETDIANDLGADSLDVVDMLMSLEDEFDVEVPDEEVEKLTKVL